MMKWTLISMRKIAKLPVVHEIVPAAKRSLD